MGILHLYMLCQNQVWHFLIFVKKCNIEFELNLCWGFKFSLQRFLPHTHKKFEILSVSWHQIRQNISILTIVNLRVFLCTEFCTPLYLNFTGLFWRWHNDFKGKKNEWVFYLGSNLKRVYIYSPYPLVNIHKSTRFLLNDLTESLNM